MVWAQIFKILAKIFAILVFNYYNYNWYKGKFYSYQKGHGSISYNV